MLEVIGFAGTYILYAFAQASVQVRLGHTWAENEYTREPGIDLMGFMLIAPIVSIFFFVKTVVTKPVEWFSNYAKRLAYRSDAE